MQQQSSNPTTTSTSWYTMEHEVRRRNLQSYASIIANEQVSLFLKVGNQPMGKNTEFGLGFTCTVGDASNPRNLIFICHEMDKEENANLILQRAITLHEVGHVKWTDGQQWECATYKHHISIPHEIMNIIEDGRIEIGMSMEYPIARDYLIYSNSKLVFPMGAQKVTGPMSLKYWMLYHAKKAVGGALPLMDESYIDQVLGANKDKAQELIEKAVIAKTETMAIEYTAELCKLLAQNQQGQSGSEFNPKHKLDFRERDSNQVKPMPSKENFNKVKEEIEKPKGMNSPSSGKDENGKRDSPKGQNKGKKGQEQKAKELAKAAAELLEKEANEQLNSEANESIGGSFTDMGKLELEGKEISLDNSHTQRIIRVLKSLAGEGQETARDQRRGLLDSSKLGKIQHTDKLFKKLSTKEKKDLAVTLLVDVSGSMGALADKNGKSLITKCEAATRLAYALATGLEQANFQCEVIGFDEKVYPIKTFAEKMRYAKSKFKAYALDDTFIANAIKYGAARLAKINHGTKRRIMFIITDGLDHDPKHTKEEIQKAQKAGIVTIGILVGVPDDHHNLFNKKIVVKDMAEAEEAVITELTRMIARRM